MEKIRPTVGVASIIWKSEKKDLLLLGLGHDPSNKEMVYTMPGGHWESGETLTEAVRREIREEANIEIGNIEFLSVFEFYHAEKRKTYLSIWFETIWESGEATVMELENKMNWDWYTIEDALKLPLWKLDRILIDRAVNKTNYGYPNKLPLISFTN